MSKFYAINRFNEVNVLTVGSGMFGHSTPEAAEAAARETAEKYGDQEFVKVVAADNRNDAMEKASAD